MKSLQSLDGVRPLPTMDILPSLISPFTPEGYFTSRVLIEAIRARVPESRRARPCKRHWNG